MIKFAYVVPEDETGFTKYLEVVAMMWTTSAIHSMLLLVIYFDKSFLLALQKFK